MYRLCDRGEFLHVRVGNAIRIAPADLAAFLAVQRSGERMALGTAPPQTPEAAPEGATPPEEPSAG